MFKFATNFFNKNLGNSQRYKGFTLAEILITLGIIGVIAEMTIPSIISNAREQEYNTGVKSAYSYLSQAVMTIEHQDVYLSTTYNDFFNRFCNVLSCIKIGTDGDIWGAYGTKYKYYKGGFKTDWPAGSSTLGAILKNGYFLDLYWFDPNCSMNGVNACAMIQIDINGNKSPNMFGQDTYRFYIVKKNADSYRVIPMGTPDDAYSPLPGGCTSGASGMVQCSGCTFQRLVDPASMK